eukprot:2013589-Pleurochrysis_carterae.AAC.2
MHSRTHALALGRTLAFSQMRAHAHNRACSQKDMRALARVTQANCIHTASGTPQTDSLSLRSTAARECPSYAVPSAHFALAR